MTNMYLLGISLGKLVGTFQMCPLFTCWVWAGQMGGYFLNVPTIYLLGVRATLHPDAPAALELSIARTRVLDYLCQEFPIPNMPNTHMHIVSPSNNTSDHHHKPYQPYPGKLLPSSSSRPPHSLPKITNHYDQRSEERRVGKEC